MRGSEAIAEISPPSPRRGGMMLAVGFNPRGVDIPVNRRVVTTEGISGSRGGSSLRYAARRVWWRAAVRGLKPTAMVRASLRDDDWESRSPKERRRLAGIWKRNRRVMNETREASDL